MPESSATGCRTRLQGHHGERDSRRRDPDGSLGPLTPEQVQERRDRYPAGKESSPEEIAAAVRFLCSDEARTITGVELPVDRGIGVCLLKHNKDWIANDPYNVKYWEKK